MNVPQSGPGTRPPRTMSRRDLFKGLGGLGGLSLLGLAASAAGCARPAAVSVDGLPSQTVWATYPTGTGTYNDVAAIANMVTNRSGSKVRIMAGDTGIARIGPLIAGTAQYSRAGDEYYYAFEGGGRVHVGELGSAADPADLGAAGELRRAGAPGLGYRDRQ